MTVGKSEKIDFRNFHQFETVILDFLKFNCGQQVFVFVLVDSAIRLQRHFADLHSYLTTVPLSD